MLGLEDIKHTEKKQDFLLWLQIGPRNPKWEDNYASLTHTFFPRTFRTKCSLTESRPQLATICISFLVSQWHGFSLGKQTQSVSTTHTFSFSTVKHDENKTSAVQENMKERENTANKLKKNEADLSLYLSFIELNIVLADCSTHRKMDRKTEQMTDMDTVSKVQSHIILIISALTLG